jgi:hypothetical protein
MQTRRQFLKSALGSLFGAFLTWGGAVKAETGPSKPKFTRLDYRINSYALFDSNAALLMVCYEIEGQPNRLEIQMYADAQIVDDPAYREALLTLCDEEAEWAADHPGDVPTYDPEWVIWEKDEPQC